MKRHCAKVSDLLCPVHSRQLRAPADTLPPPGCCSQLDGTVGRQGEKKPNVRKELQRGAATWSQPCGNKRNHGSCATDTWRETNEKCSCCEMQSLNKVGWYYIDINQIILHTMGQAKLRTIQPDYLENNLKMYAFRCLTLATDSHMRRKSVTSCHYTSS